jgi:hypothetical protein
VPEHLSELQFIEIQPGHRPSYPPLRTVHPAAGECTAWL